MAIVLVTGLPGSGKSTLAASLAIAAGLPLIAKDRFKETLFDALGVGDQDWSRRIGMAAIALQYDVMREVRHAVVDCALWTDRSERELEELGLELVQVYCECPFDVARARFFERVEAGRRHAGYCEELMSLDEYERFRPLVEPLRLVAPLIRVDTTRTVDVGELADRVHRASE